MEEKIREKIDMIRPTLQNDGGDCELVSIDGKTVTLRLKGHCGSCPFALETLKGFIQETLREIDPEITVERAAD